MKVTDSPAVWPAVAHPIRRRLIELLAAGPRTTGDLSGAFTVSRFAVMKHLRVLERSGLITVHRRGRECWNSLTIGRDLDLRLGSAAEPSPVGEPAPTAAAAAPPSALEPFRIEQSTALDASPGVVFDALTFNVSAWWGAPYLRSAAATNLVLEPQLGGRFFEEWGHRQGFLRGTVTAVHRDEALELAGRIAGIGWLPSVVQFRLSPLGRGTKLELLHRGALEPDAGGAAAVAVYQSAWADLVGVRLKEFVERGVRSGVNDRPAPPGALFGWF